MKEVLICFGIFLLGFLFGYYKAPVKEQVVYRTIKEDTPKVVAQSEDTKEIQYVAKETPQDSDVEITDSNPSVSINGKKFEMQKLPTEQTKFDKGKLEVKQGYEIKIDAKELIPKTPKWGMDIGYSNHGVKTGVEYNFNRNVSAYVEGTPKPPQDKDRFYGAGIRIKF